MRHFLATCSKDCVFVESLVEAEIAGEVAGFRVSALGFRIAGEGSPSLQGCMCVCVWVRVCVCERERDTERETERTTRDGGRDIV